MAVTRTGSSASIHSSANSGSQSISVPSDAEIFMLAVVGCVTTIGKFATDAVITLNSVELTCLVSNDFVDNFVAIYYLVNPPTGTQTLAWDFDGSSTFLDGGHLHYATYKGINTKCPFRHADGDGTFSEIASNSYLILPSLYCLSGDAIFVAAYAYDANLPTGVTWTNATTLEGDSYNNSYGVTAEGFPSGSVQVQFDPDGNSGNQLWMICVACCLQQASTDMLGVYVLLNNVTVMPYLPVYSATWDLSGSYGAILEIKFTNESTGPTLPVAVKIEVSANNKDWYNFGPWIFGPITANGIFSHSIEIPVGVKYLRCIAADNTGQNVAISVIGTAILSLS
jgi:hypothetical protein